MKKLASILILSAMVFGACSTQETMSGITDKALEINENGSGSKSGSTTTDLKGNLDEALVNDIVAGTKEIGFKHIGVDLYHDYEQAPGMFIEAENINPNLPNRSEDNIFSDTILFKNGKAIYQPVMFAIGLRRNPVSEVWLYYCRDTGKTTKLYLTVDYNINVENRSIKFEDTSLIDERQAEGVVSELTENGMSLYFKINRGGWNFYQVEKYEAFNISEIDMSDAIIFESTRELFDFVLKTARAHFGRYIDRNRVSNKYCMDNPKVILDNPILDIDQVEEWANRL